MGAGVIGTEFLKGQGLGNQLFCYVTARCIALERGCAFGTAGQEQLAVNIHSKKGMYFMDMDLGERIETGAKDGLAPAAEDGTAASEGAGACTARSSGVSKEELRRYDEKELRFFQGTSVHDMEHGCYVAGEDGALHSLPDNTLIYGNMQDERYFARAEGGR